jgi:thiamine biosynthesis lipoprotein
MGSPFNIIIVAEDSAKASNLAVLSFSLIDSFSHIYSDYDSSSDLSKLSQNAGKGFQYCSPALWDILVQSKLAFENSHHAFDISVGPLSSFWRAKRKKHEFPDSLSIKETLELVGLNKILWDMPNHQISIPKKGMKLDLGGIAKGYIAQKVIDLLKNHGIDAALADAGGDISMSNAASSYDSWIVGVNIPETTDDLMKKKLSLTNCSVATSGDAYQYIEHNGRKYSHIIDPRTGYGVEFQRNVTIIAKDATIADWLATACSILSIREAKNICKKQHAELFISSIKQGKISISKTHGFKNYWKK